MMMNSHNISTLKRRRPYGHGGSPVERVFHATPPQDPPPTEVAPISPTERQYILEKAAQILSVSVPQLLQVCQPQEQSSVVEQAAVTLEVPVASLLELSEQHRHKRPRVDTTISMSPSFPHRPVAQHGHEKPPDERNYAQTSGPLEVYRSIPEGPESTVSILGLSSSRIADCLASFTACNPCASYEPPDESYQSMATAAPYDDYAGGSRLPVVNAPPASATLSPSQPPDYHVFTTSGVEVPSMLGCDDGSLLGGYLPQYPSLPPSRPPAVEQPPMTRETMFYPGDAANTAYSRPVAAVSHLGTPQIQSISQAGVAEHPAPYVPNPVPVETPSSAPGNMAVMGDMGSRYGLLASYGSSAAIVSEGAAPNAGMDVYGRPPELDMMFPSQRAPPAKRGPFKDHAERQKTAYTRKIGSCIRCRMQRIRCHTDPDDDKGPCGTCKKVANTNKVWRLPCLRLKINDVVLSKTGPVKGYEWTRRWKDGMVTEDISNWASNEIKTIQVTEGFTGKSVLLHVREFVPQEGDSLERSWVVNGVKKSVKIPPFALVDMDAVKVSYDTYIKSGLDECCKRLVGAEKKLLWRTYTQAMKMLGDTGMDRKERQLLLSTLELWMSIRLTTTSFEIVGDETLGMTRDMMDDSSPLKGKIPLPPVMGAQLDSILIHQIQAKFRHDTLELLQRLTQENKQKTWLTTYLVTFVLLHNIALVIKHDASYALKHGIERRFAREDKVKQYYSGATTLLAYFHYRGGSKVFAPEFKEDDLRIHSGDDAVQFVAYMRRHVREHEKHWRDLLDRGEVENEYYFVAQMYEQNWLPRDWPA